MGTHRCGVGQICHNLPGSYRCDCQTGYQYDAVRKVCTGMNLMVSRLRDDDEQIGGLVVQTVCEARAALEAGKKDHWLH